MTYPRNDRILGVLKRVSKVLTTVIVASVLSLIVAILATLLFALIPRAHSQTRITPKICESYGMVYDPNAKPVPGCVRKAVEPIAPEPLCRSHSRNLETHKRTVSEWMPCREITRCRKPCWIEHEKPNAVQPKKEK